MTDQTVVNSPTIDIIPKLEGLAETGNAQAFLEALERVNWRAYSPDEIVRIIQLALAVGAYQVARERSMEGSEYYPHHQLLQDYARILAPPQVNRSNESPDPTIKMNQSWLKANHLSYRGKWVALHKGQLLATANSLKLLADQVDNTKEILFTRVF